MHITVVLNEIEIEGKNCHKGHINPASEQSALNIFLNLRKLGNPYVNQNNYLILKFFKYQ